MGGRAFNRFCKALGYRLDDHSFSSCKECKKISAKKHRMSADAKVKRKIYTSSIKFKEAHKLYRSTERAKILNKQAMNKRGFTNAEKALQVAKLKSLGHYSRNRLNSYIRLGHYPHATLFSCVDCGSPAKQFDHRDYFRPFHVSPVCVKCNANRGGGLSSDIVATKQVVDFVKKSSGCPLLLTDYLNAY